MRTQYKHKIIGTLAVLCMLLVGCTPELIERPMSLVACAPMPEGRTSATCFRIDDKAYILAGRDSSGNNTNSLFRYDIHDDSWKQMPPAPLTPRVRAAAIVVDDKVYLGLGFNGKIYQDTAYLRDWWRYDPVTNQWDSLAPYPNHNTTGVTCFTENGKIYCLYGFCDGFSREVFCYDIATDTWSEIPDNSSRKYAVYGGVGASIDGRHFFGSGYRLSDTQDWYEVDLEGKWIRKHDMPGIRSCATATATNHAIYLTGGRVFRSQQNGGKLYNDILQYNPNQDQWIRVGHLPEGRENAISFATNDRAYFGLGEDKNGKVLSTFYYIADE